MRPIEALLLLADLLALIVLSAPPLGTMRWLRLSPVAALAVAIAQVIIEGPRWQMLPAMRFWCAVQAQAGVPVPLGWLLARTRIVSGTSHPPRAGTTAVTSATL